MAELIDVDCSSPDIFSNISEDSRKVSETIVIKKRNINSFELEDKDLVIRFSECKNGLKATLNLNNLNRLTIEPGVKTPPHTRPGLEK